MNKRPLAPSLLNKLDRYLLLNRPDTWSTRIHLSLYYILLFYLFFTAVCFFLPTDPTERSYMPFLAVGIGLLAVMGFIVWMIYLLRFNVFKRFGIVKTGDRIKHFIFYYITIALIACSVLIPMIVESVRTNMQFSDEEIVSDINRINEITSRLEYDNIPKDWAPDTIVIFNRTMETNGGDYSEAPLSSTIHSYTYLDTTQLRYQLADIDSLRKVNDTMYIRYTFFNLRFINMPYRMQGKDNGKLKKTKDLYYLIFRNYHPANRSALQNELHGLWNKYRISDYDDGIYFQGEDLFYQITRKYNISGLDRSIENIASKKYWIRDRDIDDLVRSMHYITFVLALLLFMFRHTTIRTFFLTLLAGIIIAILTGIAFAMIQPDGGSGPLFTILFYFIVFLTLGILSLRSRKRNYVNGIALNIAFLMTAAIPVLCVGLRYAILEEAYRASANYYYYSYEFYPDFREHMLIAEIAGPVLLLILVETLYKKLYRGWYALPEE